MVYFSYYVSKTFLKRLDTFAKKYWDIGIIYVCLCLFKCMINSLFSQKIEYSCLEKINTLMVHKLGVFFCCKFWIYLKAKNLCWESFNFVVRFFVQYHSTTEKFINNQRKVSENKTLSLTKRHAPVLQNMTRKYWQ